MTQIICLANSRKNANRCIAGLTENGVWIRPVSNSQDGAISWSTREIGGTEPQLLDVLSIPMDRRGPNFGHQPENRLILDGKWRRVGVAAVSQVLRMCEKKEMLLHTTSDRVPTALIIGLPATNRYSLQLIRVSDAEFVQTTSVKNRAQLRAHFTYMCNLYDIVVTDPIVEYRVRKGEKLSKKCMLTVSMGGPYSNNYFKFVAAVIEI